MILTCVVGVLCFIVGWIIGVGMGGRHVAKEVIKECDRLKEEDRERIPVWLCELSKARRERNVQ